MKLLHEKTGAFSELLRTDQLTLRAKFELLPRVVPFVVLLTGMMVALYGGYATRQKQPALARCSRSL